jgi:putative peptidoglycan lipid II flippase
MIARNHHAQSRHDLTFFLLLATLACIPVGLGIFVLSEPISQLLFLRGKVDYADISVVAAVAAFGVIQLPFFSSQLILIKYANAQQQTSAIFGTALLGLLLNVTLNVLLMGPMGVAGLALATSLSMFVATGLLLVLMSLRGHVTFVSAIMLLLLWLLYLTVILCLYYSSYAGVIVALIAIGVLLIKGRVDERDNRTVVTARQI